MNFVQPIRDPECIFYIKRFLKEQSERNHMLFVTGINSGLRISDILELRVRDAKRPYFNLIEKKTKKKKRIDMTPELQRELKVYIEGKEDHEYLFKSREGINKPISRFSKQTKDLAMLQEIFNHSDQRTTLRYIGINQDAMNNAMKKFKI
ncbi:site-specific integrase [Bacillus velezensis]|uniref:tyrosine-type recombinase/integrase n=1 Tax=Bacillus velezensis TaxID=492670 RepID=UPI00100AD3FD|nr:tyrosine-type recombinase/integrase [Bacillus velezensis]MEC3795092.1 tyrosine-type recombinase/integrase [Bacillus velezensis]RXK30849.1 site-specific integrase [Bacillus velezensis]